MNRRTDHSGNKNNDFLKKLLLVQKGSKLDICRPEIDMRVFY